MRIIGVVDAEIVNYNEPSSTIEVRKYFLFQSRLLFPFFTRHAFVVASLECLFGRHESLAALVLNEIGLGISIDVGSGISNVIDSPGIVIDTTGIDIGSCVEFSEALSDNGMIVLSLSYKQFADRAHAVDKCLRTCLPVATNGTMTELADSLVTIERYLVDCFSERDLRLCCKAVDKA